MEKPLNRILNYFFVLLLSLIIVVPGNCIEKEPARIKVVVTTTHIASLVSALGGERVDLVTLIPGGACPGHFDIEPMTARKIADADVFIGHFWERRFDGILKGINNNRLIKKYTQTKGNWMVPEVNIAAAGEVTEILCEVDGGNSGYYKSNLNKYKKLVEAQSKNVKEGFRKYKGISVVCSDQQEEFLSWLGLSIAGTYGRPDDQNIRDIAVIMEKAKKTDTRLVVDNLQSGADAGLNIAKDLKIPHITLTNFPETTSYIQTLSANADVIKKALK